MAETDLVAGPAAPLDRPDPLPGLVRRPLVLGRAEGPAEAERARDVAAAYRGAGEPIDASRLTVSAGLLLGPLAGGTIVDAWRTTRSAPLDPCAVLAFPAAGWAQAALALAGDRVELYVLKNDNGRVELGVRLALPEGEAARRLARPQGRALDLEDRGGAAADPTE